MPISADKVPADRTFEYDMDPADVVNFEVDFSNYLGSGVTVSTATTTLGSAASTAGMTVDSTTVSDPVVTVQLSVASGDQTNATYDPPGTEFTFKVNATLSNSEVRERTVKFTAVQQ